jgi:hypothetical protein
MHDCKNRAKSIIGAKTNDKKEVLKNVIFANLQIFERP